MDCWQFTTYSPPSLCLWRMKTFMKTSSLFLMLCCALQLTSANTLAGEMADSGCCFNEINVRIPLKRMESYFWTSSSCPLKRIVFVTVPEDSVQKKQFCTDPEKKWVQRAINYLNKKHT